MDNTYECFFCGGPLVPLGQLGGLMHFRCRNCGTECCERIEVEETKPQEPAS